METGFIEGGLFYRHWPALPAVAAAVAPGEALVMLHGMESHSGWFDDVGELAASAGLAVYAYDRAGWGRSAGAPGHLARAEDAADELARFVAFLKTRHTAVHAASLSWGGLLLGYAALRTPALVASQIFMAPSFVRRRDLPLKDKLRVALAAFGKGTRPVSVPIAVEDFTQLPERRAQVAADELRRTTVTTGFCLATILMQQRVLRGLDAQRLPRASLLLAGTDALCDTWKTAALARERGLPCEILGHCWHSLVLEDPGGVAARLVSHVKRARGVAA